MPESVTTPDLFRIFIAVVASGGVVIGFMTFIFSRIDKRFETYHAFIEKTCASKEDIYSLRNEIAEIRNQMSQEHATLAGKVDEMNEHIIEHIQDSKLHSRAT